MGGQVRLLGRAEGREHVLGRVLASARAPDAEAQPALIAAAEAILDVGEAAMSAGSARSPQPQPPEGQVDVVENHVQLARRILDLVAEVPTPVWGRDELRTGEMWNSNSVIAWLIAVR